MLATVRQLPSLGTGYGWEWKYDGARCGARLGGDGQVRLDSRNGNDITRTFPEIAEALSHALPGRRVALDGEIVALDPATGAPDFGHLQHRLGTTGTPELRAAVPVSYVIFDLALVDQDSTTRLPYQQRRDLLVGLGIAHPLLLVPPHQLNVNPATLLELAKAHHIEGIVGKRLGSPYRPGRSPDWLKHAIRNRTEVIVGGWTLGQGNRTNMLGALLLGQPTPTEPSDRADPGLTFVGAVGTGWTTATGRRLHRQLTELATSPFTEALPPEYTHDAHWVRPELAGEVEYRSWTVHRTTGERRLRHPSFRGLRPDLTPEDLDPRS